MSEYDINRDLAVIRQIDGSPERFVDLLLSEFNVFYGNIQTDGARVRVSTGGWSENEDRIRELSQRFVFWEFWESTHRGGHYVFLVGEE